MTKKSQLDLSHLPSNSNKGASPQRTARVTKGGAVVRRKETAPRSFASDVVTVLNHVFQETIAPSLKSVASDMVTSVVEAILWPGGAPSRRSNQRLSGYASFFSSPVFRQSARPAVATRAPIARPTHREEILFDYKDDADSVLEMMYELLARYGGWVSVGDLYNLAGITGDFVNERKGWTDLSGSAVRRQGSQYVLILPPPTIR